MERRYSITPEQLNETYGDRQRDTGTSVNDDYEFPTGMVKNWEALRKHAAQILSYANPVKYEYVVRSIRISKLEDDVRAYLMNMYRVNTSYRYACQLCHKPFSNVEMCQLEPKPNTELDPMNLCLCLNCAQKFRRFLNDPTWVSRLIREIMDLTESDISGEGHISVAVNDYDFWFTQTHIAEIIELFKLKHQADSAKKEPHSTAITGRHKNDQKPPHRELETPVIPVNGTPISDVKEDIPEKEISDTAKAYKEYIGKCVFHRAKKAYAKVMACDGSYITLNFESGDKAGKDVQYDLAMCLKNQ